MHADHADWNGSAETPLSRRDQVALTTARTVPWVMGALAAGFRRPGDHINPAQMRIFMAMHAGRVSPSELAERMHVSLPTMSQTLAGLEKRGWVTRSVDPTDRRRTTLAMTDGGREVMRDTLRHSVDRFSALLAGASDEELDRIELGMKSLRDVLERSTPEHHGHHGCRRADGVKGGTP